MKTVQHRAGLAKEQGASGEPDNTEGMAQRANTSGREQQVHRPGSRPKDCGDAGVESEKRVGRAEERLIRQVS